MGVAGKGKRKQWERKYRRNWDSPPHKSLQFSLLPIEMFKVLMCQIKLYLIIKVHRNSVIITWEKSQLCFDLRCIILLLYIWRLLYLLVYPALLFQRKIITLLMNAAKQWWKVSNACFQELQNLRTMEMKSLCTDGGGGRKGSSSSYSKEANGIANIFYWAQGNLQNIMQLSPVETICNSICSDLDLNL